MVFYISKSRKSDLVPCQLVLMVDWSNAQDYVLWTQQTDKANEMNT